MKVASWITFGILAAVYFIGKFFSKDICEDVADGEVSRKYSGDDK